jgi:hypothetical protein
MSAILRNLARLCRNTHFVPCFSLSRTSVPVTSWRVGSIPMHFRHLFNIKGLHVPDYLVNDPLDFGSHFNLQWEGGRRPGTLPEAPRIISGEVAKINCDRLNCWPGKHA